MGLEALHPEWNFVSPDVAGHLEVSVCSGVLD